MTMPAHDKQYWVIEITKRSNGGGTCFAVKKTGGGVSGRASTEPHARTWNAS